MKGRNIKASDVAVISLMTALMSVCSWIAFPVGSIPVTLQTFAVFVASGVLGMKKGTVAVAVYLALGIVGIPVFSGFRSGIGVLSGATGGYIVGFLFIPIIAGFVIKNFGRKIYVMCIAFFLGTIACYVFGTIWFMFIYLKDTGNIGLFGVLASCVIPYVVPDLIKIVLAAFVSKAVAERGRL